MNKIESKINLGVWFSGASLLVTIIGLFLRFAFPTYVVAQPPSSSNPYWKIGPAEFLTMEQVAKREGTTVAIVQSWAKDGLIDPKPLLLDEHNITFAIPTTYTVKK
jgi:hypothetical protein